MWDFTSLTPIVSELVKNNLADPVGHEWRDPSLKLNYTQFSNLGGSCSGIPSISYKIEPENAIFKIGEPLQNNSLTITTDA